MINKVLKGLFVSFSLLFLVTACYNDTATLTSYDAEIYGTWYLSKSVSKGAEFVLASKKPSLTLNKDFTISRKSEVYPSTSGDGSFLLSDTDNTITITIGDETVKYIIKEVTASSMVLVDASNEDKETHFSR